MATTVLGEKVDIPIGIAPTASQFALNEAAELSTAQGKSISSIFVKYFHTL